VDGCHLACYLHGRQGVRIEEVYPALRLADHLMDRLSGDLTFARYARLASLLDFTEEPVVLVYLGNRS
jgi:hypothetical protein